MTASLFRQVKLSWERFFDAHVTAGARQAALYHLVTPWTPTEERIAQFEELTKDAPFPCQWDADAYVAVLEDEFPQTMRRFIYGDTLFDAFVTQKALLAASPIERGEAPALFSVGKPMPSTTPWHERFTQSSLISESIHRR